ncbi:hypothetical protein ZTR_09308 [Talaromyces verruculosus]|nr:hypothetical protein ZTR_09308 [Talaromyces verruculosus]
MKLEFLPILALLVPLGAAQSAELLEYRSLCSGEETEGTRTFDNGITSDYSCQIKASGPINREEIVNSAAECAAICGKGCAGVVWEYTKKNCVVYNSPITLRPHGRGSVYLKPTHAHGSEEELASDCPIDKQVCEDELANQQDLLANCHSD